MIALDVLLHVTEDRHQLPRAWRHPVSDVDRPPEQSLRERHLALGAADLAQLGPEVAAPDGALDEDLLLEGIEPRLDRLQGLEIGVHRAVEELTQDVESGSVPPVLGAPLFDQRRGEPFLQRSRASAARSDGS